MYDTYLLVTFWNTQIHTHFTVWLWNSEWIICGNFHAHNSMKHNLFLHNFSNFELHSKSKTTSFKR